MAKKYLTGGLISAPMPKLTHDSVFSAYTRKARMKFMNSYEIAFFSIRQLV